MGPNGGNGGEQRGSTQCNIIIIMPLKRVPGAPSSLSVYVREKCHKDPVMRCVSEAKVFPDNNRRQAIKVVELSINKQIHKLKRHFSNVQNKFTFYKDENMKDETH